MSIKKSTKHPCYIYHAYKNQEKNIKLARFEVKKFLKKKTEQSERRKYGCKEMPPGNILSALFGPVNY